MNTLLAVKQFHDACGIPTPNEPHIEDEALNELRLDVLHEELFELQTALKVGDCTGVLDALVDLQYVLDGAFLALGFARYKDVAFHEVHKTNMMKIGPDGKVKRREDGKILKPEGWQPPNLSQFLESSL